MQLPISLFRVNLPSWPVAAVDIVSESETKVIDKAGLSYQLGSI